MTTSQQGRIWFGWIVAPLLLSAISCGGKEDPKDRGTPTSLSQVEPTSIPRGTRSFQTDFLIFSGAGSWTPEVSSLKSLILSRGSTYQEADQSDLNSLTLDGLARFGVIIWTGGVGSTQMNGLSEATKIRLRQAVQERGVGWIGFCAGSFVAVAPTPPPNQNPSYGMGIVAGPLLEYYYLENELHAAGKSDFTIIPHTLSGGTKRDLVWYGGPVVPETQAGVIARYPNGEPSISQTWSGNGFVILSAVHPGAPQSVRDEFGVTDSDGTDFELAWAILEGALKQKELPSL